MRIYVWTDTPGTFYPDYTHSGLTAHIILNGMMTRRLNGGSKIYHPGDRCDVPAGVAHAAQVGPQGCCCIIGEK